MLYLFFLFLMACLAPTWAPQQAAMWFRVLWPDHTPGPPIEPDPPVPKSQSP